MCSFTCISTKYSNWLNDPEHTSRKIKVYAALSIVALLAIGLFAIHLFVGYDVAYSFIKHIVSTPTNIGVSLISSIGAAVLIGTTGYGLYACRKRTMEDIQEVVVINKTESNYSEADSDDESV